MKLWLSKSSSVPIHDQLRTQLILGISSGDLQPGEKLPSTPDMARRFHVHANTVRSVYRDLLGGGWTEWRRGSGYYIREQAPRKGADETDLDRMAAAFLEAASRSGHTLNKIRSAVLQRISKAPPDHILIIEPDAELRAILAAEITEGVGIRVEEATLDLPTDSAQLTGALAAALPDHSEAARSRLPAEIPFVELKSRSVARSLIGHARPPTDMPITVISGWPDFLRWAHITLTSVGLDPTAFDLRDARNAGWDRGLTARSFIITDSVTACRLPASSKPIVFRLVSDESVEELRQRFAPAAGRIPARNTSD